MLRYIVIAFLALSHVQSDNSTAIEDSCSAEEGLWSCLLEEWATSAPQNRHSHRHGRVMALPPTKGYYVSDRMDLLPPPPPPMHANGPRPSHHMHPHHQLPAYYEEWQASPPPPEAGKIVNRPSNPYKDQFKPSYPPPSPNYPIPVPPPRPQHPGSVDRLDETPSPPPKRVTETDLYLLTAIEKLVYRVDLMEKRLRKMEESMHYLVAGSEPKPDPCPDSFIRIGSVCYHFSAEALDWKSANLRCRKLRGNLLEFDSDIERRQLHSTLLADKRLRGDDWWTGGLNPGLLWIWSHSARPVLNDTRSNATATQSGNGGITGEGRCLALVHNPAVTAYVYRGQDCAIRNRYVCEREDKARLSNEIQETAKELKKTREVAKETRDAAKETREAAKETRDAAKETRDAGKVNGEVVKETAEMVNEAGAFAAKDESRKAKLMWSL